MKENTQEKSLVEVNENSIFLKIKNFFRRIFHKNEAPENVINTTEKTKNDIASNEQKNKFMESIKNIEDEETKLLKLQKKFRSGEIKMQELSDQQIKDLSDLYDKQIADLRRSNQIRKQRLLEYRKKLQEDN